LKFAFYDKLFNKLRRIESEIMPLFMGRKEVFEWIRTGLACYRTSLILLRSWLYTTVKSTILNEDDAFYASWSCKHLLLTLFDGYSKGT